MTDQDSPPSLRERAKALEMMDEAEKMAAALVTSGYPRERLTAYLYAQLCRIVESESARAREAIGAAMTVLDNPPGITFGEMARRNTEAWKILFDFQGARGAAQPAEPERCDSDCTTGHPVVPAQEPGTDLHMWDRVKAQEPEPPLGYLRSCAHAWDAPCETCNPVPAPQERADPPTDEFCPACDHGVIGGQVCTVCGGRGTVPASEERAPEPPKEKP